MKFRTEIPIPKYPFHIGYEHNSMFMGSCFSDHIGSFFENNGFPVLSNPFGVLFNPASITNAIKMAINPDLFDELYYSFFDDRWISFAHHGKFSNPDKSLFLETIDNQLQVANAFLKKTNFIFITFGTSYCYLHKEKNIIVSNCHKIPAPEFEKVRLDIEEIVRGFDFLFDWIKNNNPQMKVIFTVSPVRHLGDGFHENQMSKSILHLAVDKMIDNQTVFYFPSYEIMQDDLRDYRFYARDLCHPGDNAIEYIEEIFACSFFSEETKIKLNFFEKDNKLKLHKVIKRL
jgi:hypothetical protein